MNIDRHNYEEYFILYLDNELSSDERRMVETFVQQHPDLKDELDILFQYKLEPDTTISFTGKEELLKTNTTISLTEEEQLLLYIDNELPASQKEVLEELIAANPAVKKELVLLQKSRLQPETIAFADKASLYRKEGKVRAFPIRWWRTAAAVLLLAIGLTVLFITNKSAGNKEEVAAAKENVETPKNALVQTEQPGMKTNPVAIGKDDNNATNKTTVTNIEKNKPTPELYRQAHSPIAIAPDKVTSDKISNPVIAPIKNDIPVIAINNIPSNNLPQPENNPNIKKDAPNMATANANTSVKQSLTDNAVTSKNDKPSDIIQAAVTDDGAFTQGGNKKNKLRGLFRKVTRTFEKRTNIEAADGEGKLLVAGLSFNRK